MAFAYTNKRREPDAAHVHSRLEDIKLLVAGQPECSSGEVSVTAALIGSNKVTSCVHIRDQHEVR